MCLMVTGVQPWIYLNLYWYLLDKCRFCILFFNSRWTLRQKKKRRRRRGFAKINTTHSLKGKGINHCKTDGSQIKDSDKCVQHCKFNSQKNLPKKTAKSTPDISLFFLFYFTCRQLSTLYGVEKSLPLFFPPCLLPIPHQPERCSVSLRPRHHLETGGGVIYFEFTV